MTQGHVYWITGLSGAGKTTVGTKVYEYIKAQKGNVIRLDGDNLRQVFQDFDYSREGRKALGYQYARLCRMVSEQGVDVVICTVVMFDEVRDWNRANIPNYTEVYLEVSLDELIRRDQKGLYTKSLVDRSDNVSGVSQEAELPKHPDIVIPNYGDVTPDIAFNMIVDRIFEKGK